MDFIIKQEKLEFTVEYSGQPGLPGAKGDSAYQVWLSDGNTGTEQDFLDSLKGQDGVKGDDGLSSTIEIGTVTTLDSNQQATVENVGTTSHAVLNFGIPKGIKGNDGSGSAIENIGDGFGLYKGQEEDISQLKSLKSLNSIIVISDNIETDTINFNIDSVELNNVINSNLEEINEQLTLIQNDINNLYEDLSNNVSNIYLTISDVNTSIDNINSSISGINGQVISNTNQITSINTSITNINTAITDLQSRITTAENNITNNTNAITSLNTKVLPSGGTTGQVLQKNSATNYDVSWVTASSNAETSQNLVISFGVAVNNGFTTNNNTFQLLNVASSYVSGSADNPIPAFTTGKELYDGRPKNLYRLTDNPTNTSTSSYYSPVVMRYVGNSVFGGFSGEFEFCFEQNNDTLSKFFVGEQSAFIGVSAISTGPSNLTNCIGFGFDSSDSIFNIYVNGSSGTAIKIPVSSFTGNLIASDYQARVIQNPYFVTYKVNRGGSVITFTFTHVNSGRTGTYTLNNPAKLPAKNTPLRPMFNITCGTANMTQMDGFSVYSFYLTRNYR